MRYTYILIILTTLGVISMVVGCGKNNDKSNVNKEAIIGTWIGIDYPSVDTAIFYSNNTVVLIGRAGDGSSKDYKIDENKITLSSNNFSTNHDFTFSEENSKVYIGDLLITVGIQGDGGIKYVKQN